MGKIIKNGIDYGGGVAVDSTLDATSMNAVANKPVAEAITQLNNDLTANNLGDYVTLTFDQNFVVPSDGYLILSCNTVGDEVSGFIRGANNSTTGQLVFICDNTRKLDHISLRKGMNVLWSVRAGSDPAVRFVPFT
jgi:hypothetical protein